MRAGQHLSGFTRRGADQRNVRIEGRGVYGPVSQPLNLKRYSDGADATAAILPLKLTDLTLARKAEGGRKLALGHVEFLAEALDVHANMFG